MGNCYEIRIQDKELSSIDSIANLIDLFNVKRERLVEEAEEIRTFLNNKSKKIKSFKFEGIIVSRGDLEKRVDHLLINMTDAYDRVLQVLTKYPQLPLEDTKAYLDNIFPHYLKIYEIEKEYELDVKKFEEFGALMGYQG